MISNIVSTRFTHVFTRVEPGGDSCLSHPLKPVMAGMEYPSIAGEYSLNGSTFNCAQLWYQSLMPARKCANWLSIEFIVVTSPKSIKILSQSVAGKPTKLFSRLVRSKPYQSKI
jgi:hypothetical protein